MFIRIKDFEGLPVYTDVGPSVHQQVECAFGPKEPWYKTNMALAIIHAANLFAAENPHESRGQFNPMAASRKPLTVLKGRTV